MERDQKISDGQNTIAQTERNIVLATEKMTTIRSDAQYVLSSAENTVRLSDTNLSYVLKTASISAGNELSDGRSFLQDIGSSALNFKEANLTPYEF